MRTVEDITKGLIDGDYENSPNGQDLLVHDMNNIADHIITLTNDVEYEQQRYEDREDAYDTFCSNFAMGHYLTEIVDFGRLVPFREPLQGHGDYEHWAREDLVDAIMDMYYNLLEFRK